MFDKNKTGYNYFEIGTISIFLALLLLTIVPLLFRAFFIILDPNISRIFGSLFILAALIFYSLSLDYYKEQLIIILLNIILFGLFQLFI